ncbi:MAG: molybdenum cofactor biosynthesis protein MoeB [Gammaproteobacteria bacterium]|nr:molybdenum cofactor biosynthesis protein MoeB [Gammaproteobacteria bacterium]
MTHFSQAETHRYARHFSVDRIGIAGQQILKKSKVLLIGAGGIGSPAGFYLAAAGIGHLGIIDHDHIELSNLQRQILFKTQDIGSNKAQIAKSRLLELNDCIEVQAYPEKLTDKNAEALFSKYDIILDGSDNYPTRYLVNDFCRRTEKALVSASVFQFFGQIAAFSAQGAPCYRCLYPEAPPADLIPNCAVGGVLGVIPGVIATLAVTQAIKMLLSIGTDPQGLLIEFDALSNQLRQHPIASIPECPACQKKEFYMTHEHPACAYHSNPSEDSIPEISARVLSKELNNDPNLILLDVREAWERELCKIEPSIHIPLGQLDTADLPFSPHHRVIVHCKGGTRSLKGAKILKNRGFNNVSNLEGGILAWSNQIDPSLKKY